MQKGRIWLRNLDIFCPMAFVIGTGHILIIQLNDSILRIQDRNIILNLFILGTIVIDIFKLCV